MALIILPIETIESRYTGMMNDVLKSFADIWIYPDIGNTSIEVGEFLDVNKTSIFKAMQLERVAHLFKYKQIKDGTKFLVCDIFFPGIEMLRYLSELQGIKIEIYGINHAGRADKYDFIQKLGPWADFSEAGYNRICDKVFVGSEHHKNNVIKKFHLDNVVVTGQIWDSTYITRNYEIDSSIKEDYIIWPHRMSTEKQFNQLIEIATMLPNYKFVIAKGTKHICKSWLPSNITIKDNLCKQAYYELFAKAKWYLNTSLQETFGYTIQEAILFGCNIIAHDFACIPEMLPKKCLYSNIEQIPEMLKGNLVVDKAYMNRHDRNIITILNEMKNDKHK